MSDVLDARASHEQVVNVGQDVVRLRERPVRLEEIQCLIERSLHPQLPHQRHRQGQTAIGGRLAWLF
jgi:hypothetical protein